MQLSSLAKGKVNKKKKDNTTDSTEFLVQVPVYLENEGLYFKTHTEKATFLLMNTNSSVAHTYTHKHAHAEKKKITAPTKDCTEKVLHV